MFSPKVVRADILFSLLPFQVVRLYVFSRQMVALHQRVTDLMSITLCNGTIPWDFLLLFFSSKEPICYVQWGVLSQYTEPISLLGQSKITILFQVFSIDVRVKAVISSYSISCFRRVRCAYSPSTRKETAPNRPILRMLNQSWHFLLGWIRGTTVFFMETTRTQNSHAKFSLT